jgi:ubiquinone/menaquinone biosynthesis C-methylase UbiE
MSLPMPNRSCALLLLLSAALIALPCLSLAVDEPSPEFEKTEYQLYRTWKEGDYAKALKLAEQLRALEPADADTLYNIAALQALLGRREEAFASLKKAAETGGMRSWKMEKLEGYLAMLERPERNEFQKPDRVMAALALKKGERVADIGAGSGYFTIPVAKAVGPEGVVWALDIEPFMVDTVEKRARESGLKNVKPTLVDKDDPKLPPGGVDTILMVDTYHYVRNRSEYAKKLRAGLAPGGRVVIIDYIPKPWEVRPWGPLPHQQFPKETVDAEMAAAGLKPARVHDFLTEQYFVEYRAE